MKLEKAIEDLGSLRLANMLTGMMAQDDALKLGIEALKTIQRYRSFVAVDAVRLLPGETED